MNSREWYAHCIKNNLCVACHKPNDREGKRYCTECAKKNSKRNEDQRQFYISMGVCPICRSNTLVGGMKSCDECRADRAAKQAERMTPQKIRAYNEERRKRFKAQHRCITCGAQLPEGDIHSTCERCREKRRDEYAVKKSQQRRQRSLHNKCYICGSSDLVDGKEICTLCYKRILKNTEKMNQARRKSKNRGKH